MKKEDEENLTLYRLEEDMNKNYRLENLGESYEERNEKNEATESEVIPPEAGSMGRFLIKIWWSCYNC